MPSRAVFLCRCRSVTFEEADDRLAAGWHVELPEADALASAQRKRYLRLERERLLPSVVIPTDPITDFSAAVTNITGAFDSGHHLGR